MQNVCEKVLGVLDVTDEKHCPSSFPSSSDDDDDYIEVEHSNPKRRKIVGEESCNIQKSHLNQDFPQGRAKSNWAIPFSGL